MLVLATQMHGGRTARTSCNSIITVALALVAVVHQASASAQEAIPTTASAAAAVTVTTTREAVRLWDVPASIGLIDGRSLRETAPAHPQQVMSQIPGVAVSVTGL